jgi:hypothetical protein
MRTSRRSFLKQCAGVVSVVVGGTQLSGCLWDDPKQSATAAAATQSGPPPAAAPATESTPSQPPPDAPASVNSAPVWQPAPTIEFVEGVPAVISVKQFVQDPDQDPLVIALQSGTFLPGITWNPSNATISYDGRPLGAKPDAPVVLSGIVFSADDQKN